MARISLLLLLVMLIDVFAVPGVRRRRGFNNREYKVRGDFGRSSDERDASVSGESGGCSDDFERGFDSSKELAFIRPQNQNQRDLSSEENLRRGRAFSKASASASASAFSQNQKANIIP